MNTQAFKRVGIFVLLLQVSCSTKPSSGTVSPDSYGGAPLLLSKYDKGLVSLDDLTTDAHPYTRYSIVQFYKSHPELVSTKSSLVVGYCFGLDSDYQATIGLMKQYVKTYPDDCRGWRLMGGAFFILHDPANTIWAVTNALNLGAEELYYKLVADSAVALNQWDLFKSTVPHLLNLKESSESEQNTQLEAVALLVYGAIRFDDKSLFIKAVEGADAEKIVQREDISKKILEGYDHFNSPAEVANVCNAIRKYYPR